MALREHLAYGPKLVAAKLHDADVGRSELMRLLSSTRRYPLACLVRLISIHGRQSPLSRSNSQCPVMTLPSSLNMPMNLVVLLCASSR